MNKEETPPQKRTGKEINEETELQAGDILSSMMHTS